MIKRDTFVLLNGEVLFIRTNDYRTYTYAFYKPFAKNIGDFDFTGFTFYDSKNSVEVARCISLLNKFDSKIIKHLEGDFRELVLNFKS